MANLKKVLEGLKVDSFTPSELGKLNAQMGIFVTPHIGRKRGVVSIPAALMGVQPSRLDDEARSAWNNRVEPGVLRFIPLEEERALSRIEYAFRREVDAAAINRSKFVTTQKYLELRNDAEEAKQAYLAKRDEILAHWDDLMLAFHRELSALMVALNIPEDEQAKILTTVNKDICSKSAYAASFTFVLEAQAFPAKPDVSGLDPIVAKDVNAGWREAIVANTIACISDMAQETFAACSHASALYAAGKLTNRTTSGLLLLGAKLESNNVFKNPALASASVKLASLANAVTADNMEEIIEDTLVDLWIYGKDAELDLVCSKDGLSQKAIESMAQRRA